MTNPVSAGRFDQRGHGEAYERVLVAAFFTAWAADLVARAELQPGERVLDVGCGTGVVSRTVAPKLGGHGRVVGLDASEEMLSAARTRPSPAGAPIELHRGDATALPFRDASFDAVLCQQALQFVRDRPAALREMRRVLVPGGRVCLAVFRRSGHHEALEPVVGRFFGPDAVATLMAPFGFPDAEALLALVHGAGFRDVQYTPLTLPARFASADELIRFHGGAERIAELDAERRDAFWEAARAAVAPNATPDGLVFTMDANVVVARP